MVSRAICPGSGTTLIEKALSMLMVVPLIVVDQLSPAFVDTRKVSYWKPAEGAGVLLGSGSERRRRAHAV